MSDIMDELRRGSAVDDMDGAMIDSQRMEESIIVDKILEKWKGYENFKRVKAFEAIDSERKYQEQLNPMKLSIGDELTLLRVYLRKAEAAHFPDTYEENDEKPTMDVIRKLAGMCVHCMENHGTIARAVRTIKRSKRDE